jgi:WD40 repeat protein/serine/threonine protein kinase
MSRGTGCPEPGILRRLLDGAVARDEESALNAHIEGCDRCGRELDELAAGDESWIGAVQNLELGSPAVDPTLSRVMRNLKARSDAEGESEMSGSANDALGFLSPSNEPNALGRIGHYEVLEVVGRGGMGVVLKAFDTSLRRVVAIKVLAAHLARRAAARRRFVREAQAAAAVSHDHVVTIHAVEADHDPPYIVMQFVEGVSLQQRLDDSGPLAPNEILRIAMQAARGLAAAHAQGLVHRDIKPANILLENGVERVKITDFGLARAADDVGLTQDGVVAGTPQFMAPEQASGETVDHRSDLFSLGSVMYAMCTGRPPFCAGSTMGVLKQVCDDIPRPVREWNPEIPDWLERIVERLLAKRPADRFQSATEVADLLGQRLARLQQPTAASSAASPAVEPTGAEREQLPALKPKSSGAAAPRRRRWLLAAVVLLSLAVGLGVTEGTGITQLVPTVVRVVRGDGTLVIEVDDPQVKVTVDGDDVSIAGPGIHEVRVGPGQHRVHATVDGKSVRTELVTITRGGKQVVKIGMEPPESVRPKLAATRAEVTLSDGEVVFGEVLDWTRPSQTTPPPVGPTPLRHPPRHIRTLFGHNLPVAAVAFSPDGATLVSVAGFWDDEAGEVIIWDVASGKLRARFDESRKVRCVAFSPDGKFFATGCDSGNEIEFRDTHTGKSLRTISAHGTNRLMGVNAVSFSSDGWRLASGGSDHWIKVWATWNGTLFSKIVQPNSVLCVAFSPDGRFLAAGLPEAWDEKPMRDQPKVDPASDPADDRVRFPTGLIRFPAGHVRLFDATTGKLVRYFSGHTHKVQHVVFAPDGKTLASASWDGTVKLWDVSSGKEIATLAGRHRAIWHCSFSPDGRLLAFGTGKPKRAKDEPWEPGQMHIWHLPTRTNRVYNHNAQVSCTQFSPDGKTVAMASWDQTVLLWDISAMTADKPTVAAPSEPPQRLTPTLVKNLRPTTVDGVRAVAVSPDGKLLAAATGLNDSPSGFVRFWDAATFEERLSLPAPIHVRSLAFLPNGTTFITGESDNTAKLRDTTIGEIEAVLHGGPIVGHKGPVHTVAVSKDGSFVVTGSRDMQIKIWDLQTRLTRWSLPHTDSVQSVAISPDNQRIASGGRDKAVMLWDFLTGDLKGTLKGHSDSVECVTFSPDGRTLASAGADRLIILWDAESAKQAAVLRGHTNRVTCVAFSPDGQLLVSGGWDGTIRFWNPLSNQLIGTVAANAGEVLGLAVFPDGRRLATAHRDGSVRIWDLSKSPTTDQNAVSPNSSSPASP